MLNNAHDNHDDDLILVASVVWEIQQVDDSGNVSSTQSNSKLRVYQSDCATADKTSNDEGPSATLIFRGFHLKKRLEKELEQQIMKQSMEDSTTNVTIDVYDKSQSLYVSIDDPDVLDANVLRRFGTRLRVHVTVTRLDKTGSVTVAGAIMGRFYPYSASEGFMIAGSRLFVQEIPNQQNAGTGVNVWDGALLLARYLEKQPTLIKSRRVLELGAGCGLVGISAGVLGAKQVLLTDLPYCLSNMQANVESNSDLWMQAGCQQMICHALDWYYPPTLRELGTVMMSTTATNSNYATTWKPDVILVADCVWMQELVEPLIRTIKCLAMKDPDTLFDNNTRDENDDNTLCSNTKILISYQRRGKSTHEEFWTSLHTRFGDTMVSEIDTSSVGLAKPECHYLLSLEL